MRQRFASTMRAAATAGSRAPNTAAALPASV